MIIVHDEKLTLMAGHHFCDLGSDLPLNLQEHEDW
jgi:hypothetical protein